MLRLPVIRSPIVYTICHRKNPGINAWPNEKLGRSMGGGGRNLPPKWYLDGPDWDGGVNVRSRSKRGADKYTNIIELVWKHHLRFDLVSFSGFCSYKMWRAVSWRLKELSEYQIPFAAPGKDVKSSFNWIKRRDQTLINIRERSTNAWIWKRSW